jgi:hypothetical protein
MLACYMGAKIFDLELGGRKLSRVQSDGEDSVQAMVECDAKTRCKQLWRKFEAVGNVFFELHRVFTGLKKTLQKTRCHRFFPFVRISKTTNDLVPYGRVGFQWDSSLQMDTKVACSPHRVFSRIGPVVGISHFGGTCEIRTKNVPEHLYGGIDALMVGAWSMAHRRWITFMSTGCICIGLLSDRPFRQTLSSDWECFPG